MAEIGRPEPRAGERHRLACRTGRLYLETVERLAAIDLKSERVLWEKSYEGHCCDRLDISPDGSNDLCAGVRKATVVCDQCYGRPAHHDDPGNGLSAPDDLLTRWQARVPGAWESARADGGRHGHSQSHQGGRAFQRFRLPVHIERPRDVGIVNVDSLVGFEVGDLRPGWFSIGWSSKARTQRPGQNTNVPATASAIPPDDRELWVADGVDNRLHIFDATMYPPALTQTLEVAGKPRWIAFSRDATYAYGSNGDVMDRAARHVVARLMGEDGSLVQSERMVEVTK